CHGIREGSFRPSWRSCPPGRRAGFRFLRPPRWLLFEDSRLQIGRLALLGERLARVGEEPAQVGGGLALVGEGLAGGGGEFALVGGELALVGGEFALVGGEFALVGEELAQVGEEPALLGEPEPLPSSMRIFRVAIWCDSGITVQGAETCYGCQTVFANNCNQQGWYGV